MKDLFDLILSSHCFLDRFDYDHYPADFSGFENAAAPFFRSLTEEAAGRCAEELVSCFSSRYDALNRRSRKEACFKDKQVLALFLTPAARRFGGAAAVFSECLNRSWNDRFGKETYQAGDFDAIMRGFDANMLGLPLRKSKNRGW